MPTFVRGTGGSPADFGSILNMLGLEESVPTGLYDMGRANDGVQVGLSLLPSVRHCDQLCEHRECSWANPNPKVLLSTNQEK